MSLRPSVRTEVRRWTYKITIDAAEGRRRREDDMVSIRKSKREENLDKKRREGKFTLHTSQSSIQKKLERLPELVSGVHSDDSSLQLECATQIRKLLSCERSPPIDAVVQSGVLPRLVEFLDVDEYPSLQFEAAWALTNITSGTSKNTKAVVDEGAIPLFVKLLVSPSDEVCEQAVWALGNIAGDSSVYRDLVLSNGALGPLMLQLNDQAKFPMLRNGAWTLSNLCRGKPEPYFEQMKHALPTLNQLINSGDEEVITDACWALSHLSDGTSNKIQSVLEAGVVARLIELLEHHSESVVIPALRTVGNIVTGNDDQTQHAVDCGVLSRLLTILTKNHQGSIKKEACWTISNITAGNKSQIQAVIKAQLLPPLVLLLRSAEFYIKREAAWAISNATGGTHDQIKYMVELGCIQPLCDLLNCPDPRTIMVCLQALENILKVGKFDKDVDSTDGVNEFAGYIEEAGGLDNIENLQMHENTDIHTKSIEILVAYWLDDSENDMVSTNAAPPAEAGLGLCFPIEQ